jgi:hypothetical protein
MKKIDDVQRASILRSEAYLRKKMMQRDHRSESVSEIIFSGVLFALVAIGIIVIGLAL